MRRWNGWGDESIEVDLPRSAAQWLAERLGPGEPQADADLLAVLRAVPASRLPPHRLVDAGPEVRLRHARGQSLPDWIALRSGRIGPVPDGVAFPESEADVRALLSYARETGACVIPYGGGTSVAGHVNPPEGPPVLTVDLGRMNRLLDLDPKSRLATLEAGVAGPLVESQLRAHGFTLGHFPQSFEHSTLGGWIATRSCGQQSLRYGRIEALFAGGRVETPSGPLVLAPVPASAAGPDLRQLVLGSEGRVGVITQATVRVRPFPEDERFHAVVCPSWAAGVETARALAQAELGLSMLRLSDPDEAAATLALAGGGGALRAAVRGLGAIGYGEGRSLLVMAVTGARSDTRRALRLALATAMRQGALPAGAALGERWRRTRFQVPYLRNALWAHGYAVDTLETAVPWSQVPATAAAVRDAIHGTFAVRDERVLVQSHLSHVYRDGASLYVTVIFRRGPDPDERLAAWRAFKTAATEALHAHGGALTHQHGVGTDLRPWLAAEAGAAGTALLTGALRALDPTGLMNPGKLLP